MVEPQRKIAVLIDGDNATPSSIPKLLEDISTLGILLICHAYGDWAASNMSGWKNVERTCSVELKQQSRYVAGKNATDMAIVIDAMDILYSGKVDTFCLVSSDSDFTPLAFRLKKEGCQVIGVGSKQTNEVFINACTRFITIDTLTVQPVQKPAAAVPKSAPPAIKAINTAQNKDVVKAPNPVKLLKKAYQAAPQENGWVLLNQLGQALRQLDAGFKSGNYGHSTLGKLVRDYPDVFDVKGDKANVYVKLKV
jgi:hypothetical protein